MAVYNKVNTAVIYYCLNITSQKKTTNTMLNLLTKKRQRFFSSYIVKSPYKDIKMPSVLTLAEFISSKWTNVPSIESKIACVDGITGDTRTFGDYKNDIDTLAAQFIAMGLKHGDSISLQSPNHVDFLTCICAAGRK